MPESLPESIESEFRSYILGFLLLWVVFVFGAWYTFGEGLLTAMNVTVSTVLTATLVLLYFKQASISERQADIMSLGYEPKLSLEKRAAEEDTAYFEFKNTGPGTAIGVNIAVSTSHSQSDGSTYDLDLSRVDKPAVHPNVLQPSETGVYAGEFAFELPEHLPDKEAVLFSEAAKTLREAGVDNFMILYHITYTNALGDDQSDGFTYNFPLREGDYELERYFGRVSGLSNEIVEEDT